MGKLSCIIQVGPKYNQMLPYEGGRGTFDKQQGTGNVTTRLRLKACSHPNLEKAKKRFSPRTSRECGPGDTLILAP